MPSAMVANQVRLRGRRISLGIIFPSAWKWPCRIRHGHLYLILDLYSRKIVGFEVHETDDSEHAVNLLRRTASSRASRNRCARCAGMPPACRPPCRGPPQPEVRASARWKTAVAGPPPRPQGRAARLTRASRHSPYGKR